MELSSCVVEKPIAMRAMNARMLSTLNATGTYKLRKNALIISLTPEKNHIIQETRPGADEDG